MEGGCERKGRKMSQMNGKMCRMGGAMRKSGRCTRGWKMCGRNARNFTVRKAAGCMGGDGG